jgi:O-antigen/teichoic acid export membrane protein
VTVVGSARAGGRPMRRAGLSLADQLVSSVGNIVLTLLVAHTLSLTEFGTYALILAAYQVWVSFGQALVGEPLLVLSGRLTPTMVRGAMAVSVLLGLLALPVVGLVALSGHASTALVVVGLLMPGLLLQDGLRYVAFAAARPAVALLSDLIWTLGQLGATAVLLARHEGTVPALVLAWGLPSLVGAASTMIALRLVPAPRAARGWITATRRLTPQYLGEAVTNLGAFQVVLYLTGLLAGVAAAGQLRIIQVIFGPVHVAVAAARAFGIPEAARRLRAGTDIAPLVRLAAAVLGLASLLWTVLIGLAPDLWGRLLPGAVWSAALVWLLGAQKTVESAGVGPFLVHRAKERARWTFLVRCAGTAVTVGSAVPLIAAYGAEGGGLAMLLGSVIAVSAWWWRYQRDDAAAAARYRPRHTAGVAVGDLLTRGVEADARGEIPNTPGVEVAT